VVIASVRRNIDSPICLFQLKLRGGSATGLASKSHSIRLRIIAREAIGLDEVASIVLRHGRPRQMNRGLKLKRPIGAHAQLFTML